ncbi:TPA: DNA adenine methylase [Staphylococcus aureus]|uniref:DNA adenine methylase n=1 Tax=Staphylococcus chromogenes TaxID=46126 RepID=UPI000E686D0C|nr:DNA adenine methylase [Staphylococcus chromogenes]RIL93231.1 DNA adenine methylase [Staphylococcus chromogenes]
MTKSFTKTLPLKPFTKWTGGKRQLLPELKHLTPQNFNEYYEPFVGGGAFLFDLKPNVAFINDANEDLINAYRVIRDNVEELIDLLEVHKINNTKEYYYKIRNLDRSDNFNKMSAVEKAARILYMLRVNFNGLYRVNSKGQFNTPYGRYSNPKIVDRENLLNISEYLKQDITITSGDFYNCVQGAKANDFVYFDPPYIPISTSSNFTSYTANKFDLKEQERLRDTFIELDNRGVYVMLSNSNSDIIYELYNDYKDNIKTVDANRMINSNSKGRGKIKEVIITNY